MKLDVKLIRDRLQEDACRCNLDPSLEIGNKTIFHYPSLPHKDVYVSFIDPNGKYVLLRRYNVEKHWGDCEIPEKLEVLLLAIPEVKEANEKINVSGKPGIFKRDSKG